MKNFILALGLLATTPAFAQTLVMGVNGGVGINTNPSVISESSSYMPGKAYKGISTVGSVTLLADYAKWQYGVEAGYRQISYNSPIMAWMPEYSLVYNRTYISKTAFPVKAVVNRKIKAGHFENYAGISVGYLRATQCEDMNALDPSYFDHVNGNGMVAGLQAGSTYFITRHLGINAGISGEFMWMTVGAATYKLFDFPATVGVRYKL